MQGLESGFYIIYPFPKSVHVGEILKFIPGKIFISRENMK